MAGSPIIVNLSTTDLDDLATWDRKNGQLQHGPDSYYTTTNTIINPILNIESVFEGIAGVGNIRTNEASSRGDKPNFSGGGVYYSRIEHPLPNTAINTKNTILLTSLTNDFMTKARATGGVTMSLILHGKDDTTQQYSEAKYIQAAVADAPSFDSEFYRKSAYISFHSRERLTDTSIVPSVTYVNIISLRKNFKYNYISIPISDVAGMLVSSVNNADNTITLMNKSWGDIAGLSANALVTFQEIITPNNEMLSAESNSASPGIISCSNRSLVFVGFNGSDATFRTIATNRSLFFGVKNYQHNGYVAIADPTYGFADPTQYQLNFTTSVPFLRMRSQNSIGVGNKNLLQLDVSGSGTVRFFGSTPGMPESLGIEVGSYIRLSGFDTPSNNGIYQVIARYDGVPGDENNLQTVPSTGATVPRYQYLELSRDIVGEFNANSPITVRNVSNLPILHIKYEYTP
jgi:hypothetical protein